MPEATIVVKNTFISFDLPRSAPLRLLRSATCPTFFPRSCSLEDEASWEGANQVLCHAMAPKLKNHSVTTRGAITSPMKEITIKTTQEEYVSTTASCFATPTSSPRDFSSAFSESSEPCHTQEQLPQEQEEWTQVTQKRPRKLAEKKHSHMASQKALGAEVRSKHNDCRHFQRHPVGIVDDDDFRVVRRLLGPGGKNLKHISEQSNGAKVWISGKGSSRSANDVDNVGPLTLCIRAASKEDVTAASARVLELLESIHEQYHKFCTGS